MENRITFYLERAYLEGARSFFPTNVVDSEGKDGKENYMTEHTVWALVSISYSMSYNAILAFATRHLKKCWVEGYWKEEYPGISFHHLTRKKIGGLKKHLIALCKCLGKEKISNANNPLWMDLCQLIDYRHFVNHPNPDQEKLQKFFEGAICNRVWEFAPSVASDIIGYFYEDLDEPRNDWLRENQEFKFLTIKVITDPLQAGPK